MDDLPDIKAGEWIEHMLLPGYSMVVLEVGECEITVPRQTPHNRYKIVDPENKEDWLCAYDVRKVIGPDVNAG